MDPRYVGPADPFALLRESLGRLVLPAAEQRRLFAGAVVTDELVLDLDNAVVSIDPRVEAAGVELDPGVRSALKALNDALTAPSDDPFWRDEALDAHPAWLLARAWATDLLARLPEALAESDQGPVPLSIELIEGFRG
ncbi:hypothetical protein [Microlunatus antarcticus]|uniref:Uncharacterized protein n=1 Tax=Microlunatus antarcticus TaxID=53388 RepID=A0A7W5JUA9_9ACTN|nr:hypothetical protein [Microlunatus antarcticus]MBB3326335.1 hypothetical protein [Microlunatus antarcticus]